MAPRQMKMPVKDEPEVEVLEPSSATQAAGGRPLLASGRPPSQGVPTPTPEAAQAAAMVIKRGYPILQVRRT